MTTTKLFLNSELIAEFNSTSINIANYGTLIKEVGTVTVLIDYPYNTHFELTEGEIYKDFTDLKGDYTLIVPSKEFGSYILQSCKLTYVDEVHKVIKGFKTHN